MNELKFDEKKHRYTVGDKELVSVTTFVKKFFPEFDVKRMSKIIAKRRRENGEKNSKGKPLTAWDVKREWKAKGTKASSEGTLAHVEIEEFINGKNYSIVPAFTKKAQMGVKFLEDTKIIENKLDSEQRIFNEALGLAGTIDLVSIEEGGVTLIDWKTNKEIKKRGYGKGVCDLPNANYYHYQLQLSLYAYLLEQNGLPIKNLYLVHLKEDGYSVYEMEYKRDIVEVMLYGEEDEEIELDAENTCDCRGGLDASSRCNNCGKLY